MNRNRRVEREVVREDTEGPVRERVVEREVHRDPDYVPAPRERYPVDDPDARYAAAAYQDYVVRVTQIIWLLTIVLVGLIGIRFVLKLLAASANAGFTRFVYGVTDLFLAPFAGLTATPSTGGVVLELPALIAMIVYTLLGWVIVRLIWILFRR